MTIQGLNAAHNIVSYIVDYNDLAATSGAGAKTITLEALPAGTIIRSIRVKHSAAFAGTNLTSLLVRVGKSGGATNFFTPDFEVCSVAPATGTLQESFALPMGELGPVTLQVTFTPTGAQCSACTAGQVAIDVDMARILTPASNVL